MSLIVTGGAGFIGSHLVRLLVAETTEHIHVIDKLTYAGNLDNLADVLPSGRVTVHQHDICDSAAIASAIHDVQPQGIFHLAAETHVDRSISGPSPFVQTNIVGTYTLLEAARVHLESLPAEAQAAFRFIHVSTDEVYGSLELDEPSFTEASPYRPRSPYSASKASSDHLVHAWHHTYGLPTIITHSSNNYGPNQFPEKLIPVVIRKALSDEPIPVYGDGRNVRDWLHVEDHARAMLAVWRRGRVGETYNIGGEHEVANIDLVQRICHHLDQSRPRTDGHSYAKQITLVPDRPGHDTRYSIDNTKVRTELNWQPTIEFEQGLRVTIESLVES